MISIISKIAMSGSVAHEIRRNEVICSVKTLDYLTKVLQSEGFNLKLFRCLPTLGA